MLRKIIRRFKKEKELKLICSKSIINKLNDEEACLIMRRLTDINNITSIEAIKNTIDYIRETKRCIKTGGSKNVKSRSNK